MKSLREASMAPLTSLLMLGALCLGGRAARAQGDPTDAMNAAEAQKSNDTITFDATVFATPRKVITLNGTALPQITFDGASSLVSITAPLAGVEINGNGQSRVFIVTSGARATLKLQKGAEKLVGAPHGGFRGKDK